MDRVRVHSFAVGVQGSPGQERCFVLLMIRRRVATDWSFWILGRRPPESRSDDHELMQRMRDTVLRDHALPAKEVLLVPRGSIPKTSSGKRQRACCRAQYLAGEARWWRCGARSDLDFACGTILRPAQLETLRLHV